MAGYDEGNRFKPVDDERNKKPNVAGDADYLALLDEMRALHIRKAQDYGSDEDPLANIKASGEIGVPAWKGAWLRAKDKVKRIDRYCVKGTLANEGVEDSFKDLAAYALLALVLFRRAQKS